MHSLVSVIVPVYKVEDCLRRCLDSLCEQSLPAIEVLLIDDASPDRCGEICDLYAAKDVRFKVFHNEINRGLSTARNIGIKNAYSNYLMFVDSDDFVHKDFCKDAYECATRYQADLVMFRRQYIKKAGCFYLKHNNTNNITSSGIITRYEGIDLLLGESGQNAMTKLYRKELFYNISYPPGYLYEDVGTTYKIVWKASQICYLDKVLYYHCYRPGSITTQKTEKNLHDLFEMFMQQYQDLATWGYPADKLEIFLQDRSLDYCANCYMMPDPMVADNRFSFCENILLTSTRIPAHLSWKRKVLFTLFKRCRPLFRELCVLHGMNIC